MEDSKEKLTNEEPVEQEVVDAPIDVDDGKIHFPVAGLIICGVLVVAIIVCIIVIFANKK